MLLTLDTGSIFSKSINSYNPPQIMVQCAERDGFMARNETGPSTHKSSP